MTHDTNNQNDGPRVDRRRFLLGGTALGSVFFAGCASNLPDSLTNGSEGSESVGAFRLLISDQPVAIGEFDSLDVSFDYARIFRVEDDDNDDTETNEPNPNETDTDDESEENESVENETDADDVGFTPLDLEGATVDLTQVVGEDAMGVFEGELKTGQYAKIELHAQDVEGIVDDEAVEVMIPSGKLQLTKPFEVVAGETVSFVFDINVVKRGNNDSYNLLPVISESGVAGEDVDVNEINNAGDDSDEADDEGSNSTSADTPENASQ